jgi:predicted lipoprotein with Yx(FWY)xxD motif
MRRLALILAAAALATGGCGSSGDGDTGTTGANAGTTPTPTTGQPPGGGLAVKVGKTSVGAALVDGRGHTLYAFSKDTPGKPSCTGACERRWPPAVAAPNPRVGAGVAQAKLSTVARPHGERQLVFNGHPLYRYAGDEKPGDLNGQGKHQFGGDWYVLSPQGDGVKAKPR